MNFRYSNSNKRYHTLDYFYKSKFDSKVFKVSLNADFTCPNIDGTKDFGGCIYCLNGSGDSLIPDLKSQFNSVLDDMLKKWPKAKYIGYFQANTNTYAPLPILKEKYETILKLDNVIGLNIATRCDSISDEVLEYLSDLNKRTYLTIELGLQTIHESTAFLINRGHNLSEFEEMVKKLKKRNINVVVHIINGLPYETKEMMIETAKYVNKLNVSGIKIHMLSILKGTKLESLYNKEKFNLLSKEEYIDIVCDQLENLNEEIVIHRITGDPKVNDLIEPDWLVKKISVINDIDKELKKRNTYQGYNLSVLNFVKRTIDLSVKDKDIVIDMTVGNGNDTLYLCDKVKNGHVFGFDIQECGINNTKLLLKDYKNVTLINDSHTNLLQHLNEYKHKVSLILFNLGYLPNGDKSITTDAKSTIEAIKNSLELLNDKGVILVVVYPGHEEGLKESKCLHKLVIPGYQINEYHNTDNKEAPYLLEIKKTI